MEQNVIAIVNRKGGCGKTTTAKNISYMLATKHHKKVLLIDFDPQCNATRGLSNKEYQKTVLNVLDSYNIRKCIYRTYHKFDVIPGSDYLASKQIELGVLERQIKCIQKEYDYIIIDTSPDFDQLIAEIIKSSSQIIIPTEVEADSLDGMTTTINELKALCGLTVNYKILYTKVDNSRSTQSFIKDLDTVYERNRFNTVIRENRNAIKKARLNRQPLEIGRAHV